MPIGFYNASFVRKCVMKSPVPGVLPDVTFEYKPLTPSERGRYEKSTANDDAEKLYEQFCRLIAAKVTSWDLVDQDGKPVPIDAKVIHAGLDARICLAIQQLICMSSDGEAKEQADFTQP